MSRRLLALAVWLARLGAAASLATTVAGMLVPAQVLPDELPSDLMLHGVGFGVPALLAAFSARAGRGAMLAAGAIAVAAVAAEAVQWFVPGRMVSAIDVAAGWAGIAAGAALGRLARTLLVDLASAVGQS